jgi:hypothetical protein
MEFQASCNVRSGEDSVQRGASWNTVAAFAKRLSELNEGSAMPFST